MSPWVLQVKQILDDCGLSYLWLSHECGNTDWLRLTVERMLKDQFVQNWRNELNGMTSCDVYVEFKQEFKLEKYLLCENQKYRQAICNFRVNNNRIRKVSGRYKGLDRSQRFCNLCNDNRLGDEFHILLECRDANIATPRQKYMPKYYMNHPSMFKLILLLQSDKPKIISKLGAFLKNVLLLFK